MSLEKKNKLNIVNKNTLFCKRYFVVSDHWLVGGCVLGGLSSLVLGRKFGTKALLLIIRCIQLIAIIIIFTFYTLQQYDWAQNSWVFGIYSTLMLQVC